MKILFLFFFFSISIHTEAQIKKQFFLNSKNNALVLTVGKNNKLVQTYFGKRIDTSAFNDLDGVREVYLTAGMQNQFEPAIRIIHSDGNPSLELIYISSSVTHKNNNVTITNILLKDPEYDLEVILHYTVYFNEDVFESGTEIINHEKKPVVLTNYASNVLHFNSDSYWLTQFHGDWAREMQMVDEKLTNGIKNIESKLGSRTNFYQTQAFFVSLDHASTETSGEVIGGTLAWTGNFRYTFEVDQRNGLRILSGINPYASPITLASGAIFSTPAFIFSFSSNGKGVISRNFHQWARSYGVLDGEQPRMTLLNNWEATHTDFNESKLKDLMGDAKKLGVDLFLLDDGWFGNKYPRNNDKQGLGDWQEDRSKLPHGIGYLVKEAEQQGIKFGIWLEPEMVNPKSELYERHPEWVLKLPNRELDLQRNQLVLDLINPQVQDFIFSIVDSLLTRNPKLAFIKWDCNRSMTNEYSPYLGADQSGLFIEYTQSLYKILDRIRAKYPHFPIMLCSGGGGRTDYGALKYFTEFWPSDNTDPVDRIFIQWGYSYFFPANIIAAHVTNMGKQSLKFKTDVAMMDKLGYDIKVQDLTPQEILFSNNAVKTYKEISKIIWYGDIYRIESPYQSNRAVVMYVDQNKKNAILFNYHLHTSRKDIFNRVLLQGLDKKKKYRITEIDLFPGTRSNQPDNNKIFSGDYLMTVGLNLSPGKVNPLTSNVYEITEEN